MAPQPPPRPQKNEEDTLAHIQLLSTLDTYSIPKPFRSSTWKPNQRRNKNVKTILGDANRSKDAAGNTGAVNSVVGTHDNSGVATPITESGIATPARAGVAGVDADGDLVMGDGQATATGLRQGQAPNFAEAEKSLSKLVLSKSLMVPGSSSNQASAQNGINNGSGNVSVTYTNIESAPSLAHSKHYCDITGLAAPYTDPKTRLRYHNKEVFVVARSLGQGAAESYLEARGAHVVLK